MHKQRSSKGFTLIELMITVAIIGILAAVAYPSYTEFVQRSNRSEGLRELLRLANLQEQLFVDSRSYGSDTTKIGLANPFITESATYSITVTASSATSFTLTAAAKGSQLKDTGCTSLTINELGAKTPTTCWEK
jgi:type IV pilus assembly protein PilE